MRSLTRVLLSLLVVATVAAGCGGDDGEDIVAGGDGSSTTVDPDTPVSSPDMTVGGPGDPDVAWARIEPTEDLVNPVVAVPDEVVADPEDPNAVLIRFFGGVRECYGARAAVVDEDADRVRVRLEVGAQPGAGDRACIEIAEAQELQLVLATPVDGRRLVAVDP